MTTLSLDNEKYPRPDDQAVAGLISMFDSDFRAVSIGRIDWAEGTNSRQQTAAALRELLVLRQLHKGNACHAFQSMTTDAGRIVVNVSGLSKRDVFAALALHALAGRTDTKYSSEDPAPAGLSGSKVAVGLAEGLIAELNKAGAA